MGRLSPTLPCRLKEIERQRANFAGLTAMSGPVEAVARMCGDLERERVMLGKKLPGQMVVMDFPAMRRAIEARVRGLLETLQRGAPAQSRTVLRSLLGDRRLRVGADAERGFRVDGLLEVEIEIGATAAQDPGPGRLVADVAGGALPLRWGGCCCSGSRSGPAESLRSP